MEAENSVSDRCLQGLRGAGLAALLIAAPATARAQSVISSETTEVTLAAAVQPDGRITLTANVAANGGGVPGGALKFIDESTGGLLGITDVAKPSIAIDRLAPGEHRLRVDYSGTSDFLPVVVQPSQSAVLVQHVQTTPAVTVLSSREPGLSDALVTLTAVVSSRAGTPAGAVTFRDGARVIAAHVGLDRAGTASFTTSELRGADHAIVADYEGDTGHAPATSR